MSKVVWVLAILAVVIGVYHFWPKDQWLYLDCENGIYLKYPAGVANAPWSYYDSGNKFLAQCGGGPNPVLTPGCAPIVQKAGQCRERVAK